MHTWVRPAILLLLASFGPAAAEPQTKGAASPVPPPKEQQTLETFGDAHTACLQWTDGCAVCLRHADGSFGCSLPGIACQPTSLTCRQMVQDHRPAGGSGQPGK